jgi:hypothetical protein
MGEQQASRCWTVDDELAADIGFALPRAPVRKLRRAFTEDERRVIARAIVPCPSSRDRDRNASGPEGMSLAPLPRARVGGVGNGGCDTGLITTS